MNTFPFYYICFFASFVFWLKMKCYASDEIYSSLFFGRQVLSHHFPLSSFGRGFQLGVHVLSPSLSFPVSGICVNSPSLQWVLCQLPWLLVSSLLKLEFELVSQKKWKNRGIGGVGAECHLLKRNKSGNFFPVLITILFKRK